MQSFLQIFDILLPLIYAAVLALYVWEFWRGDDQISKHARRGLYGLLAGHVAYLVARWIELGFFPLGSKAEFYSWLAISVVAAFAIVDRKLEQSRTGAFFIGISLVFQILASVFMTYETKHALLLENPIYALHVVFMIFGVTALAVGAIYALMHVLLSRQLKSRDLGVFFKRLPPLRTLERMSKISTVTGTVLLGLGLLVGYLVAYGLEINYDLSDPKYMVTNSIWLGYVLGIIFVRSRGIPGLKLAYATVAWFVVLLVSVGVASHSFQHA